MHRQALARYNFERLCNNLPRVQRFNNFRTAIANGYFPKLDSLVASRSWPPRQDNVFLEDVNRPTDELRVRLVDMEKWRDRVFEAIEQGYAVDRSGKQIPLTEDKGIDILGNIVEASSLSPNMPLYGQLHNMGHVLFSYIHDPDGRNMETFGIMGDTSTAMRDPIFYRWHGFIDGVFQRFKSTLPRYTKAQLDFNGITITDVEVGTNNNLETFWQQSDVDLSRGLDFQPRGNVFARFTHLQHRQFQYTIHVNNAGASRRGTVRILLAPKNDERGLPWLFTDQRLMFIELDKFTVNMRSGTNTIIRRAEESTVTIPFEQTFRNLDNNRPTNADALRKFNFCGCGWPQHLLIPKGTQEGMPCELFVMISDYAGDTVNQDASGSCSEAPSYCGIRDQLYPDKRSMGYPFDRAPEDGVTTLAKFLTGNMKVRDITITFKNVTELHSAAATTAEP